MMLDITIAPTPTRRMLWAPGIGHKLLAVRQRIVTPNRGRAQSNPHAMVVTPIFFVLIRHAVASATMSRGHRAQTMTPMSVGGEACALNNRLMARVRSQSDVFPRRDPDRRSAGSPCL